MTRRYELRFVVKNRVYYGAVQSTLAGWDIRRQISLALDSYPAELP
ncbi:MAG: hypothetical protein QHC78_07390 [Pigmentiphaga sp.]|nr:hypothetical protein [Pigmentiphaga sp.]MDX3905497.1 hypothetical protein [Pigmentiphaga sp.]